MLKLGKATNCAEQLRNSWISAKMDDRAPSSGVPSICHHPDSQLSQTPSKFSIPSLNFQRSGENLNISLSSPHSDNPNSLSGFPNRYGQFVSLPNLSIQQDVVADHPIKAVLRLN
jgi:hypothetical protein